MNNKLSEKEKLNTMNKKVHINHLKDIRLTFLIKDMFRSLKQKTTTELNIKAPNLRI